MTEQTQTTQTSEQAAPEMVAAVAESMLGAETKSQEQAASQMPEGFEGGADAWGKLDDAGRTAAIGMAAEKAKADSAARVEAFGKASARGDKVTAWNALTKDERSDAFKGLTDEAKKELGLETADTPIYAEFKLPEGAKADEKMLADAVALFRESGLPQEQAQKFVDMHMAGQTAAVKAQQAAYEALQDKWVQEIKADPEIGGAKWTAAKASAARAIDRLDVPGLREALSLTGAGNNPAVVKAFVRLGRMIEEDSFRASSGPATPPLDTPQRLYGPDGPRQSTN